MLLAWTSFRARASLRAHPRAAIAVCLIAAVGGMALAMLLAGTRTREPATGAAAWFSVAGAGLIMNLQPPRGPEPLPRPAKVVTFEQGCSNARCHSSINDYPVVHAPVGFMECQACHAADAGNHTFPLVTGRAALCASCHDTASPRTFQHQAMTQDACLACHDPHGSNTRSLLVEPTLQDTCASCHPNAEGSSAHPPYATGRCDVCHDPHGAENRSLLLTGEGPDACLPCHAAAVRAVNAGPHAGKPGHAGPRTSDTPGAGLLREKSCTACHAPHAGSHDGLLARPARALCTSCHAQAGSVATKSRVTHDAVLKGDQCVTCHDPHGSGREHSLRNEQQKLCLTCHDKPVTARDGRKVESMASLATAKVVHGAVREGECSACHSVHGSEHDRLLRQVDPGLLADPHAAANYTLCFACHDAGLARPGPSTQFRDDQRNLHEVHLRAGPKPRGCSSCHSVHSSDLPRLIARAVNFEGSGWSMPMTFNLTADGGRCDTSCHEPLGYSRLPGGARARRNEGAP